MILHIVYSIGNQCQDFMGHNLNMTDEVMAMATFEIVTASVVALFLSCAFICNVMNILY